MLIEQLTEKVRIYILLLVEGSDDLNACYHLFKYYGIEIARPGQTPSGQRIEIISKEGLDKLLESVPQELDRTDLKYLGIIIDADMSAASRWQRLHDILLKCGYTNVPKKPDEKGTIIRQEDKPTVGVWIMPDNELPGMLEDFCSLLVPPGDRLWTLAERVLPIVIRQECRFGEKHRAKALIHTWLAWQKYPGRPMGQAISEKYFDPEAPQAQIFIQWVRDLFEIELKAALP